VSGDEAEACVKKVVHAPSADVAVARIENLVVSGHPMVVRDIVRNADTARAAKPAAKVGVLGAPQNRIDLSLAGPTNVLAAEGQLDRVRVEATLDATGNEVSLLVRAELGSGAEAFAERIESERTNAEQNAKSPLAKEALAAIATRASGGLLELTVRLSGDKAHIEKLVEIIFELGRLFWTDLK
jgi:hypothetical protein